MTCYYKLHGHLTFILHLRWTSDTLFFWNVGGVLFQGGVVWVEQRLHDVSHDISSGKLRYLLDNCTFIDDLSIHLWKMVCCCSNACVETNFHASVKLQGTCCALMWSMLALMLGKISCKVEKFRLIHMNPCDMGLTATIGGIQEEIIFQTFFLMDSFL